MAAVTAQLKNTIEGGAVSRLTMPEKDELLISIRNNSANYRLLISAGASIPLIYLSEDNKPSPLTAPAFCMLLRKYLSGSRIINVHQKGLERIITIDFEHRDDLGELSIKHLIFEMMGKYSNIIFTDADGFIIDSIKRVPSTVSSLREVLPRRRYVFPDKLTKIDPFNEDLNSFKELICTGKTEVYKLIYTNYSGFSPIMAQELCCRAHIDCDRYGYSLSDNEISELYSSFKHLMNVVLSGTFEPNIIIRKGKAEEFSAFSMSMFDVSGYEARQYDSISRLLDEYYSLKESFSRIRQKTAELRKTVTTLIERTSKKHDLQLKQLKDCEGKDRYKIYGDLLNTYGYSLKGGEKSFSCENYYDNNKIITIPLDSFKTAAENAKRYYDKYAKLRRTEAALSEEIHHTERDMEHLSYILQSLETSSLETDISQIRDELSDYGYLKKKKTEKSKSVKSEPMHMVSGDGFDIYIGKNNYQNEEVTFKIGDSNDLWFHAKKVPGSHVIVKTGKSGENIPDRTFKEAAALAAFYSKNGANAKVEVDYTLRKNLKRTPGGPPGFVIYNTYYSLIIEPKSKI